LIRLGGMRTHTTTQTHARACTCLQFPQFGSFGFGGLQIVRYDSVPDQHHGFSLQLVKFIPLVFYFLQ
jgi:hypothetical protein